MKWKWNISGPDISKEQTKEFGILIVLVTSVLALYSGKNNLLVVVSILALLTLLCPVIFYPFAVIWFGFSKWMGKISTGILLGVVFFIIVIPVGLIRKMMQLDALKIKQFKKTTGTVMINREHIYEGSDLLHTF
jgi:hypothetical protein